MKNNMNVQAAIITLLCLIAFAGICCLIAFYAYYVSFIFMAVGGYVLTHCTFNLVKHYLINKQSKK
jgi:purine-cytosine permease-like protein